MGGKLRPWQVLLFVAAIGAVGFAVFRSVAGGPEINLRSSITLIDAETGELYEAPLNGSKSVFLPARRPDNGPVALLPIVKNDDGEWIIHGRYRNQETIDCLEVEPNAVVDVRAGTVKPSGSRVRSL